MKKIKIILSVLVAVQLFNVKGQHEFIVTINSATGGIISISDSLPGVNWIGQGATTFDRNNHRYIFQGIDFSGNIRLYCIDAISGVILSQPLFSVNSGEFHYDNTNNTLYCLCISGSQMFVASLNLSTAAISNVATLPVVGISDGTTFFDEASQTYVLQNSGSFYSVNVITGIVTVTPASTSFYEMQFDNVSGIPYGLVMGSSMHLVKINVTNGTYVVIDTLPNGYASTLSAFDESNHVYVFGTTNNLYFIDVNTGNIISNPIFPPVPINVIELHYDNSNATLFALHWGDVLTEGITKNNFAGVDINIFPNPMTVSLVISLKKPYKELKIFIYNSLGQLVQMQTSYNSASAVMQKENLSVGVYHVSIICDDKYVGTKKIVVE